MAKAKAKRKTRKAAKGKKRGKVRAAKPKRKSAAKRKKVKPKRKVGTKAKRKGAAAKKRVKKGTTAGTAKLKTELKRLQQLHSQLHEQIRAKDTTISMQMQEIMELKKALEDLRPGPMQWRP
jgi:hypothetical protein